MRQEDQPVVARARSGAAQPHPCLVGRRSALRRRAGGPFSALRAREGERRADSESGDAYGSGRTSSGGPGALCVAYVLYAISCMISRVCNSDAPGMINAIYMPRLCLFGVPPIYQSVTAPRESA